MRKTHLFLQLTLLLLFSLQLTGQVPQMMSYQAVVRNSNNELVTNQRVRVRVSIIQGLTSNVPVFIETHIKTTSDQGLLTLEIGSGRTFNGSLNDVPWSKSPIFTKVEIDLTGGTNYTISSTTQMLTVPYAFYAEKCGTPGPQGPQGPIGPAGSLVAGTNGQMLVHNGQSWIATNSVNVSDSTIQVNAPVGLSNDKPIFEVKNSLGQVVFAVYETGVRIYVEDGQTTKGTRGGFAVGGIGDDIKGNQEYFRVTSDSIRAYVGEGEKGTRGGFAVGGIGDDIKGANDLMYIGPDMIRAYINKDITKGTRGGFAVGGIGDNIKGDQEYFRVTTDSTRIYVPEGTVKGTRGGFAVGGIGDDIKGANDLMYIGPDMIRAYINKDITKGTRGGFAVGGIGDNLKGEQEYFRVTTDSTRIYVPEGTAKGTRGGFAVGGIGDDIKGANDLMYIGPDKARIFIDTDNSKRTRGGFAVGGIGDNLKGNEDYLLVTPDSTRVYVPEGIVKGTRGGFAVGGIGDNLKGSQEYFRVDSDTTTIVNILKAQGVIKTIPELLTSPISLIKSNSAVTGGTVLNDGGSPVTARGVCWSTTPQPTFGTFESSSQTSDGTGVGPFTSNITGLIVGVRYYVRAYAVNSMGVSYGQEFSFTTAYAIGETYEGGIIFYINRDQGLVADSGHPALPWNCQMGVVGATGQNIGDGETNTSIAAAAFNCTEMGQETAPRFAQNWIEGEYNDWFLPSSGELEVYFQNISNTAITGSWSSTESDSHFAYYYDKLASGNKLVLTNKPIFNSFILVRKVTFP